MAKMMPGMGAGNVEQTKQAMGMKQGAPMAEGQPEAAVMLSPTASQRPDAQTVEGAQPTATEPANAQKPMQRIGKPEIRKASELLKKYREGKQALETRIKGNEQWYKLRHWEEIGQSANESDPEPASAWLLNCLLNKHADAMDNYPMANVLPRERSDESVAKLLSEVLPSVLEQNGFESCYSDAWWKKLKQGTGAYGIFWDASKENGIGDIDVRPLDLLNLFWEPGVNDIQKGRNFFHVDLMDVEVVEELFPEAKGSINAGVLDITKYTHDENINTDDKALVVDWYYRRRLANGRKVLHYCKFSGETVLFASENEAEYQERGYYDHGKYPFVFDVLFPDVDMPTGFGYLDIGKSPQKYIDKLDQVILKNAILGARPRFFRKKDGSVNDEQYRDVEGHDFVDYSGSENPREAMLQIDHKPLDAIYVQVRNLKIDELKETTANRDVNQGGTATGVTAASAISAMMEAGSKTSRDMIKQSYRAFTDVCYLCIDLMRQFYQEERFFRVVGDDGRARFESFNGQAIAEQQSSAGQEISVRMPVFDISVSPQKSSPFSTYAQNERAKELFQMGFFAPQMADQATACLEMMQFDDIDKVRERISQNGLMMQKLQQLGQIATLMAAEIDAQQGSNYAQQVMQLTGQAQAGMAAQGGGAETNRGMDVNGLGEVFNKSRRQTAEAARNDTASKTMPRA